MSAVDPRRSVELLTPQVEQLNASIGRLTEADWNRESSCTGWSVGDLVAHVVVNGFMVHTFAQRAVADDPTPAFGPPARAERELIKASGPGPSAERQARENAELVRFATGLADSDWSRSGSHPLGPRSVSWIYNSRLVEVVFHHWDLRRSLGEDGPLDSGLAAHMLPFLLDVDYIGLFTSRIPEVTPAETFRFTSNPNGATWRLAVSRAASRVEEGPGEAATIEIAAEPGWLALAVFGRASIDAEQFHVLGPLNAPELFRAYFGG